MKFGRGPATVIGVAAVSQDTHPCQEARALREKERGGSPIYLVGLIFLELEAECEWSFETL